MAAVDAGAAEACGAGAVAAMLIAASKLGARNVQVLSWATSGDVTGDHQQVRRLRAAVVFASDGGPHDATPEQGAEAPRRP